MLKRACINLDPVAYVVKTVMVLWCYAGANMEIEKDMADDDSS